ncbi:copper-binding protein [Pseudomonas sp.]|jgi:Cu(I)/Ag(I) efflux system periplasmic protein CusF|uniref:copper-binding protein n=1 Tax=Pseudomonas sp. TaxID=306 RepID=UPI00272B9F03|nr:copper-binding protein [Pseudomonas sp.]
MNKYSIAALMGAGLLIAMSVQAGADAPMSEGEVRRLAEDRVTLRHGPIDNLKMPPMTMVFRVSDAAQLEGLEVGDAVRFRAEQQEGSYVITALKKAKDAEVDEHARHH